MSGLARAAEVTLVALLLTIVYVSLYSSLPIDDTARFTHAIAHGYAEWDPAHFLMQPAAMLWHKMLGFGASALASQHHFNTFCAVFSLAIFHAMLLRVGVGGPLRLTAVAAAAFSFNVLNLATSGHIKLAVFPWLMIALWSAIEWERKPAHRTSLLLLSGVAIGMGTMFLSNTAFIAPFQCLVIGACWYRQSGRSLGDLVRAMAAYTAGVGATAAAVILTVYVSTQAGPWSAGGLLQFLTATDAPKTAGSSASAIETASRLAFGTSMNFSYGGDIGAILKAVMQGEIDSVWTYAPQLAWPIAAMAITVAVLAYAFGRYALLVITRRAVATPLAFVAGILAFAAYWNLNESEFFFQITVPSIALLALAPATRVSAAATSLLMMTAVVTNLTLYSIPKQQYPFDDYVGVFQSRFTSSDLFVFFERYPGKQYVGFFAPHLTVDRYRLDGALDRSASLEAFFSDTQARITAAQREGRRVFVFGALDRHDWNAPWPNLRARGISKQQLIRYFENTFAVEPLGEIAEIPYWRLHPGEASRQTAEKNADSSSAAARGSQPRR